ncbi:hypothetical protein QE152_g39287 [Popillia japonica]|uniref:Uncharacterized protein n=1 Tax=Popillia japonica TaxID=7064 RepID=A0AAW1HU83_POPJA
MVTGNRQLQFSMFEMLQSQPTGKTIQHYIEQCGKVLKKVGGNAIAKRPFVKGFGSEWSFTIAACAVAMVASNYFFWYLHLIIKWACRCEIVCCVETVGMQRKLCRLLKAG